MLVDFVPLDDADFGQPNRIMSNGNFDDLNAAAASLFCEAAFQAIEMRYSRSLRLDRDHLNVDEYHHFGDQVVVLSGVVVSRMRATS